MVQMWKRWCRLCAHEDVANTHVDIFFQSEEISPLANIISNCFSINVNNTDDYPKTLCIKCHQLMTFIHNFAQKTAKVQEMYSELYNSMDDTDAEQLKAHYDLPGSEDLEVELKFYADSPVAQPFESKVNITPEITEQLVDLDELEYIDEEMLTENMKMTTNVKIEQEDEEEINDIKYEVRSEPEQNADALKYQQESECDTDSDQNNLSTKVDNVTKPDAEEEKPRKVRGRPKKYKPPKPSRFSSQIYNCTECYKAFSRYFTYRHHMRVEHNIFLERAKYPCTKCEKVFLSARRLKDHGISHLPLDQKLTMPCPYCDKKFTKAIVVQAHVRAVHLGEKPFVCEECGKTYKAFGSLKEHKLTHVEEKPFKCAWCDKRFKSNTRLKIHEDTHNETNYICPTCGLQLNTRRTLRMHMVVHSDQKQHKCDFCGNEYKRAKALKNHLILHTGLKPYTCNFCDKTFANGSNCRSHKKKAHPTELAALEAAGANMTNTNIPKLEQLRAMTANKSLVIETFGRDTDFGDSLSIVSLSEDEKPPSEQNTSPIHDTIEANQTDLVRAVYGHLSGS